MTPWEEFGRWAVREIWAGSMVIDGSDVQEKAEALGLIVQVPYDPEKHGDGPAHDDVEPGEMIFEFAQRRDDKVRHFGDGDG